MSGNGKVIKAVIFDFDGVIADSESLHLKAFRRTVEPLGLQLSAEDYYSRYLAFDDRTFFAEFLRDNARPADGNAVSELVERKAVLFEEAAGEGVGIFPGVEEFLGLVSAKYPAAIGSGAFRSEIEVILAEKGLSGFFALVVGAEDTRSSKPSPEVYLRCLDGLRRGFDAALSAPECVVFEDSPHGALAAKRAGMKCVGITNSCAAEKLEAADRVIGSFFEIMDGFPGSL